MGNFPNNWWQRFFERLPDKMCNVFHSHLLERKYPKRLVQSRYVKCLDLKESQELVLEPKRILSLRILMLILPSI